MELFERVRIVAEFAGSAAKLAKKLDISPNTFTGYLKIQRQNNLWPILPQILKNFPQVSREWLYFDEGEMLRDGQPPVTATAAEPEKSALTAAQDKISELEADLREERRLNRQLTARLLFDDAQGKKNSTACEDGDVAAGGQG